MPPSIVICGRQNPTLQLLLYGRSDNELNRCQTYICLSVGQVLIGQESRLRRSMVVVRCGIYLCRMCLQGTLSRSKLHISVQEAR